MSFLNFAVRLKLAAEEINATRENESVLVGKETTALIRNRVQTEKLNAEGQPFGQYSRALVPQWFFYNRSISAGAETKIKTGDWFQSYADFKEANNQDPNDINFTFTGDMWRNTGVNSVKSTEATTTVTIGGQTTRAQNIQEWQEPRYGNILETNENERQFIKEAHEERITKIINKYL
jgi:hypothetical protein